MPISLNLRFLATPPKDDEFDHPPGAPIMRELGLQLASEGWKPGRMEDWRNCGWSLSCRREGAELEVALAEIEEGEWMLQVSPLKQPGVLGRLFGGKLSATPSDVFDLAVSTHRSLAALRHLGRPRWRWDDFPEDEHSSPEPQAP